MYFYTTLILTLIADTISKLIAENHLSEKIYLLSDFVFLQYVENTWIAFSIQIHPVLLKIMTIVLIIAIFYYYKSEKKQYQNSSIYDIAFGLILWWALGNAYERIFYEKVIDFLWIQYFSIMNLADIAISVGAGLFILLIYKTSKK